MHSSHRVQAATFASWPWAESSGGRPPDWSGRAGDCTVRAVATALWKLDHGVLAGGGFEGAYRQVFDLFCEYARFHVDRFDVKGGIPRVVVGGFLDMAGFWDINSMPPLAGLGPDDGRGDYVAVVGSSSHMAALVDGCFVDEVDTRRKRYYHGWVWVAGETGPVPDRPVVIPTAKGR